MDSFSTIFFQTADDVAVQQFPADEENGGGGSGNYCVVAAREVIDETPADEENGGGGSGNYCVVV